MIRPEKDLKNPPGQWINPDVGKIYHDKPLTKEIDEYQKTGICYCEINKLGGLRVFCGDCVTKISI